MYRKNNTIECQQTMENTYFRSEQNLWSLRIERRMKLFVSPDANGYNFRLQLLNRYWNETIAYKNHYGLVSSRSIFIRMCVWRGDAVSVFICVVFSVCERASETNPVCTETTHWQSERGTEMKSSLLRSITRFMYTYRLAHLIIHLFCF